MNRPAHKLLRTTAHLLCGLVVLFVALVQRPPVENAPPPSPYAEQDAGMCEVSPEPTFVDCGKEFFGGLVDAHLLRMSERECQDLLVALADRFSCAPDEPDCGVALPPPPAPQRSIAAGPSATGAVVALSDAEFAYQRARISFLEASSMPPQWQPAPPVPPPRTLGA